MTNGFFVGRFQPFTAGHEDAIKQILQRCTGVVIGIGSSQESNTPRNPFSAEERKAMIQSAKILRGKNYKIICVPDIDNPPKWVEHIENIAKENNVQFDEVFTSNGFTKKLFEEKGYKVNTLKFNKQVSGTHIRESMCKNNEWESFVSKEVKDIISKMNGVERVKNLINTFGSGVIKYDEILQKSEVLAR